jgi:hypothetical protein
VKKEFVMSVKVIMQQIEIGFWDVFIIVMQRSAFLQFFVPRIYRFFYSKEVYNTMAWVLVMIIFGLTFGVLIGAFSQI